MSIFKETFPKFVRDQLKQREEIISSGINPLTGAHEGSRSNNFYTYTLNKQCTLRLSSGVNLKDDFDIDGNTGNELAKRNVLQGGIQWNDLDKKSGGLSKPNDQGGYDGAYGSTQMRGDSEDGYGIVPMPGITDAQIRTKSAYGSLREAKVKFQCHNKRQLEVLEILYMRPGYNLLLEWQWSPYIDNDGNVNHDFKYINGYFDSSKTMIDIEKEIIKTKEDTGGNYDALMGYCKNFSYTARPDGGFDCETQIIAKGEIIESLRETEDYINDAGKKASYEGEKPALETLLTNLKNYHNPAHNPNLKKKGKHYASDKDREAQKNIRGYLGVELTHPWVLPKNTEYIRNKLMEGQNPEINPERIGSYQSFTRWDAFCHALNKLAPKGESGTPLYEFTTFNAEKEFDSESGPEIKPLTYNKGYLFLENEPYNLRTSSPYPSVETVGAPLKADYLHLEAADMSSSPNVCMLSHQFFAHVATNKTGYLNKLAEKYIDTETPGGGGEASEFLTHDKLKAMYSKRFRNFRDVSSNHKYAIGGIYINNNFMLETFQSLYYDDEGNPNKDFSIFKFIEEIWEGVNGCSDNHNFKLNTENRPEGVLIRIIDMKNVDGTEIDLENVHELKVLSPDSTVRNVNYNTTLPSSLSATIAIAAQAPDNVDELDKVTFGALNKNTTDRFNDFSQKSPSNDQINKWNQRFDSALEDLALGIYIGYGDGTNIRAGLLSRAMLFDFLTEDYANHQTGKGSDDDNAEADKNLSVLNKCQLKVNKAINILRNSYASDGDEALGANKYYRGQILPSTGTQSSIIPLKFNCLMDGIGGLIIGNVFKLPKDKLPVGYQGDDIYFIVMGEEQKITSGQDWTTTISGHLILLNDGSKIEQIYDLWKQSWAAKDIEYNPSYLYSNYTNIDGKNVNAADQQSNHNTKGSAPNTSTDGANNNSIECKRLIKGNKNISNNLLKQISF